VARGAFGPVPLQLQRPVADPIEEQRAGVRRLKRAAQSITTPVTTITCVCGTMAGWWRRSAASADVLSSATSAAQLLKHLMSWRRRHRSS
jgi:hypothetical protein